MIGGEKVWKNRVCIMFRVQFIYVSFGAKTGGMKEERGMFEI